MWEPLKAEETISNWLCKVQISISNVWKAEHEYQCLFYVHSLMLSLPASQTSNIHVAFSFWVLEISKLWSILNRIDQIPMIVMVIIV